MLHEELGDIGMQPRNRDRTIERRQIAKKPIRHAARLEWRHRRQHGPVPSFGQALQDLAPRLAGRSNGVHMKAGNLIDVLVRNHQSQWNLRLPQGLGIEVGRKGNHGDGGSDARVDVSVRRGV